MKNIKRDAFETVAYVLFGIIIGVSIGGPNKNMLPSIEYEQGYSDALDTINTILYTSINRNRTNDSAVTKLGIINSKPDTITYYLTKKY